jgi:gamma-glutamyl-gamma-aminobutyrate hydrolase PuuD
MQLLTVVAAGSLVQHLPDELGHDGHRPAQGGWAEHEVRIASDSLLGRLLGTTATVHSSHHQGIARLGSGLRPTAWAPDGTVEAVEVADAPILGVLWHPEVGDDLRLFAWLVEAGGR